MNVVISVVGTFFILACGLCWADEPLGVTEQTRVATQPNMIFIMADDLGYGDLGCFGQKVIATPRLDQMAREGMRFTQFYAGNTVCAPSRCVLLTGQRSRKPAAPSW